MDQDLPIKRRSLWLRALIGVCLLLAIIIVIVVLPLGYVVYGTYTLSTVMIDNRSGEDVRFEQVTIDDQTVWAGPDIIIKTKTNLQKPYLDTRGKFIGPSFRVPKKVVELRIVTVNEMQEKETVACALDNRSSPCFFSVHYFKGRLECSKCQNYLD
jgi:hypothetical protein